MKKPTFEGIIKTLKKRGMKVFTSPYSVNLGGFRTFDNKANTFNDWLYTFYHDNKGKIVGEIVPGTVDAGLTYRLKPINAGGTAIIQHGVQHLGAYQLQDPTKDKTKRGHNGQKAFRQIKPMAYWRDNNKDSKLDYPIVQGDELPKGVISVVDNGSTNGHYMGTVGRNVDNWSAGCWGSTVINMNRLYKIADVQISKGLGDIFSFTLNHESSYVE